MFIFVILTFVFFWLVVVYKTRRFVHPPTMKHSLKKYDSMRCWICSYEDVKVGDALCDVRLCNQEIDLSKIKYVYMSFNENGIITEIHKIMSEEDVNNQLK